VDDLPRPGRSNGRSDLVPGAGLCRRRNRRTRSCSYDQSEDDDEQGHGRLDGNHLVRDPSLSSNERVRWSTVAAGTQLPESLKRLVEAWQMEGASRDEIVGRLDQLDLLAHEERIRLMIELLPPT